MCLRPRWAIYSGDVDATTLVTIGIIGLVVGMGLIIYSFKRRRGGGDSKATAIPLFLAAGCLFLASIPFFVAAFQY